VFVRLAGCNAWDGRPETRATSACPYCDTDFRGGERMAAETIIARAQALLTPYAVTEHGCVLSGGEPLLQADADLLAALGAAFPWVDVETNGTRACPARPANVQVVCSPKHVPGEALRVEPDCWKLLIPDQERFLDRALASARPIYLQPVCPDHGPQGAAYTAAVERCLELCHRHGCRLSLQLHKYLGLE